MEIMPGMKLKCIFAEKLPGKEHGPNLKKGDEYECKSVHIDSKGNAHINVGLPLEINHVTSFATGEELPGGTHWCHPNRFVIV
jgi:hypothetical protein